jgi:hypothetical protein
MYDMVPASEMNKIFDDVFARRLTLLGFESVGPRKWVRSKKAPIREIFEMAAMKGASHSARWGVSLDFVPHLSGSSVRWHRTAKTAMLDLCYDPCDYENNGLEPACSMFGVDVARSMARKQAEFAFPMALPWFESVNDLSDLVREYKAAKLRPAIRFGFYNYIQQPLAFALVLAKVGRVEEAVTEMTRFLKGDHIPESIKAKLLQMLDDYAAK